MRNRVKSYWAHVNHCNGSKKGAKTGWIVHKYGPDHKYVDNYIFPSSKSSWSQVK